MKAESSGVCRRGLAYWSCLFFILCASPHLAAAEQPTLLRQVVADGPVEMTVELDRAETRIADPIILRVQVDAPDGTLITFPLVGETLGQFAVIATDTVRDLPLEAATATRRSTARIELESLESGELKIPPLEVLYRLPESIAVAADARDGSLTSEPISVQVISVLEESEDPKQFRDIKDIAELPPTEVARSNRIWLAMGATLLACATAGLLLWSRRRRRPPPGRWALGEVDRIESEHKRESVDVGSAYSQLSTVLREYLEAELAFPATSFSSEELVDHLASSACPQAAKQRLKQFVRHSDELKFSGRQRLGNADSESPFDAMRAIIRETSGVSDRTDDQEPA